MAFTVGQRVRVRDDATGDAPKGKTGTVTCTKNLWLTVKLDDFSGHDGTHEDCGHRDNTCSSWNIHENNLVPLEEREEKPIEPYIPQVGDLITVDGYCSDLPKGEIARVEYVKDGIAHFTALETGRSCYGHRKTIKLYKREGDITMSNVTSNPLKALKSTGVDADTRLLRELAFEDEDGTPKSNAIEEMRRRNWQEVRTQVAADLRAAMAQERADKAVNDGTAPSK